MQAHPEAADPAHTANPSERLQNLVNELQTRVEERKRTGEYPPGVEEEVDAHLRRLLHGQDGAATVRQHLEALSALGAELSANRIPTSSRVPGGALMHRIVAKVTRRQTEQIFAQLRDYTRALHRTLEAVIPPDALEQQSRPQLSQQLDLLANLVAAQQRSLNGMRADLLAILERRIRDARPSDAAPQPFAPLYNNEDFEAAFRGTRNEVIERYRDLASRLIGCEPVLDLGFGRGELLELCDELGIEARGVEVDPALVTAASERGLDVLVDDGNTYLRQLADGSLGGLSLIQVVEHLSPQDTSDLVVLAHRKVRAGGRVIIETVNPQSLCVFARSFYLDPTHVRPVHPSYLEFLFREAGFAEVEIDWRNPPPRNDLLEPLPGDDEATRRINANIASLNALLFAPQDYAIIATR